MPDLDFAIIGAEGAPYAAAPTLIFKLALHNTVEEERIHAIVLRAQVRLEARQRSYDADAKSRLLELFGEPDRWQDTLKSLLWTHAALSAPSFTGHLIVDLPIVCTYDFDVVGAKYLHALQDGDIPLLFLFSGTVFYEQEGAGMQVAQIPWEKEAAFRLPVRLWREMMDRYFPNSAWLRIHRDLFDRLCAYKARHSLLTWEETLERLLAPEEAGLKGEEG
jgi:hypothetical protein